VPRDIMKYVAIILLIFAAIVGIIMVNVKSSQTVPVASGSAGVLLFVFLWFVLFVIPKLEDR
jgi:heme A synthase